MRQSGTARERHLAQSLSGARSGSGRPALSNVLFRPTTLISLILIGFFAFGALIVLGGFAKDLRKTEPGQATPRSISAVGYKALTEYLERLDYNVEETRGKRDYYDRSSRLVIYSPSRPTGRIKRSLKSQDNETRLIILPKWAVHQMRAQAGEDARKGWVRKFQGKGVHYESTYRDIIEDLPVIRREGTPSPDAAISFENNSNRILSDSYAPDFEALQYFDLTAHWVEYIDILREIREMETEERRRKAAEERGEKYEPKKKKDKTKKEKKKTDSEDENGESEEAKKEAEAEAEPEPLPNHEVLLKIDGRAVLIRLEDTQTYILSEPDLVNTMAFQSQGGAQIAGAIIDDVISHAGLDMLSADFDVSLHGIESNRNIIKLMVTPPFLAATLCLLAAGGLVAWQGFNRFGDPERLKPDYAQGPVSLARTAADFMGVANRAHQTGEDYAELIRRQVAAHLGYKSRTSDHIDTLLNAREKRLKIQPTYQELKRVIAGADPQSYGQYARALTTWRDAMTETDLQNVQTPSES